MLMGSDDAIINKSPFEIGILHKRFKYLEQLFLGRPFIELLVDGVPTSKFFGEAHGHPVLKR